MMKIVVLMLFLLASTSASDPFTLVIKTDNPGTSGASQFTLPLDLGSSYDFTVDWGDGTTPQIVTSATSPTHTYASAGTYTVQIAKNVSGGFPRIVFNGGGDCKKLLTITQWGNVTWSSMDEAFNGCSNLIISATDASSAQTGAVTSFRLAWAECTSLTSFPALDTSAGTEFFGAWEDCHSLTSFPALDTSAATDLAQTWYGCSGLTAFPLLDTAQVSDFNLAWQGCSGLTAFPLLDCHAGTDFSDAWQNCSSLTGFPVINTAAGVDFTGSWTNCSSLTSFPLLNTASGTSFSRAWANCHTLTDFPLLDTAAGTDFSIAWSGCTGLTHFPLLNTAAGTTFHSAWQNCTSLTSFPDIDCAAGLDFSDAWGTCTSLTAFATLNLGSMQNGAQCFTGVTLSPASYSALLNDLAAHNSGTHIVFDGGLSTYNSDAISARNTQLIDTRSWTITDGGIASPVITSPASASALVGTAFTYQITATNMPIGYTATGLLPGLGIDNASGLISGTPTGSAGSFAVAISATNADAIPGTATLTITVQGVPVISSASTATGTVGQTFSYQITATNAPTSFAAAGLPGGLAVSASGLISGTPVAAGMSAITLSATNVTGTGHAPLTLTIAASAGATTAGTASATAGASSGGGGGGGCGLGGGMGLVLSLLLLSGRQHCSRPSRTLPEQ